ncbi:uncharacterized protein LOC133173280 [Saccostrea echinata]|uniref:uncharacterized protein LOC133173280 n=1 Tax=Saccostrea echinata TaxID=191078 RepID=UPI002A7FF6CF|nr:uncharacterized protein LOC133173280 [Saccostrea echinata]
MVTPSPARQISQVSDDSGIGSLDMTQECLDELAVRKSFVFLKDNIIYEVLQDDLRQECLVSEKEEEEYVCNKPNRQSTCERLIKHIIKKKRCEKFINLMNRKTCHVHVAKKLMEARKHIEEEAKRVVAQRKPPFVVTDELLQKHLSCLHIELEPREIADEMFQAGYISDKDHDAVTDPDSKYKRVKELLKILKKKKLYSHFVFVLQSLKYVQVLGTLEKDRKMTKKPTEYATCIQQNFCLLKEELPDSRDAKMMVDQMYGFLDQTNISDINWFTGARKQKSKLLKILLIKGKDACEELFRVMEVDLERNDLIDKMEEKSAEMKKRGMPRLDPKLRSLRITCLEDHEDFLSEELEPLELCDLLFEESAIDIPDHDRITETEKYSKQIQHFLETIKKNENNCFHYFLHILKSCEYCEILKELEKPAPGANGAESNANFEWRATHSFATVASESVQNRSINIRLAMEGATGSQVEQALHQQILSSETRILEEAITHGQMNIEDVSSGSVVIQLRPVTDQAVQTLLNARENNRLVELILGMIKRVNVPSVQSTEPLEVRVQVSYSNPTAAKPDISKAKLIKERINVHRNELISELEPKALTSALSKSNCFEQSMLDAIEKAPTSHERTEKLLSLIENGDSKTLEAFISALKNIGYSEIVELIDPAEIHSRAENIRKVITSNYKNILDEMQIPLARETLSKCIGDVDTVQEKILPKNGKRRQRMNHFLQFILKEDHNVIQFEKMLRNNGLEDLLKINENIHGEHIAAEDIEMTIAEDPSSEGVLFESLLTLSLTVTSDRETKEKRPDPMLEMEDQLKKRLQEETVGRIAARLRMIGDGLERPEETFSTPETFSSPEKPFEGNKSISSSSSSSSLHSIISPDVVEEKSKESKFTKYLPRFMRKEKEDSPLKPSSSFLFESPSGSSSKKQLFPVEKTQEFPHPFKSATHTELSQSYLLVAAIDFGTTYSGYAFSWKEKPQKIYTQTYKNPEKLSEKEPTVLLLDKSERIVAFGQDAVEKYKELCEEELHHDYFYFSHFKMNLHRDESLNRRTVIQDDKGKECLAVKIFSMSIQHFKDRLLHDLDLSRASCSADDIRWVLTVPAIWGEQAKQMMQESAYQAGIQPCNVMLALEPEVASVYVKEIQIERQADELSKYRPGKKFLVMDLGGGTADLTAMEVARDGSLKQLFRACGGDWGGNKINDNFVKLLGELFGHSVIEKCKYEHKSDFLEIQHDIEVKKRKFSRSDSYKPLRFEIPYSFVDTIEKHHQIDLTKLVVKSSFNGKISMQHGNKLELTAECVETMLFNPVVNKIKQETEDIIQKLKGQIEDIMMVGGFSESKFVYDTIRETFPRIKILRASEAGLAVLKGAVLFGHTPRVISSRRCAFTYGVGLYRFFLQGHDPEHLKCDFGGHGNICVFVKLVTIGEEVGIGQTYEINEDIYPVKRGATHMSFKIYRSTEEDPKYVDKSCLPIGKLTVKDVTKSVKISLSFGLTQITVTAVNTVTGENVIAELDLLGEL